MRRTLSYHAPLLAALERPQLARVLSAHEQAVNLLLPGGSILALVAPAIGNGPGAILVGGRIHWEPGAPVCIGGGAISGPGLDLSIRGAQPWTPPPHPPLPGSNQAPAPRLAEAVEALAQQGSHAGLLPAALAELKRWVYRPEGVAGALFDMALAGIARLRQREWEAGARSLAGLGPGLTPAGDDFLAGYLCALVRGRRPGAADLAAAVTGLPATASPAISRHLLNWAARGVAGEHHLAWLDGVLAGAPEPPLAAVLAHGATSGADWAAGGSAALVHAKNPSVKENAL